MKKIIFMTLTALICSTSFVHAQNYSHRLAAEELLDVMNVRSNVEDMYDQMSSLYDQNALGVEVTPEMERMQEELMMEMKKTMSWENVKEDYVGIYTDVFTQQEIEALVQFYRTPIGRKLIEKQPELMQRSMEIGQKRYMQMMPKMMELMQGMFEGLDLGEEQ